MKVSTWSILLISTKRVFQNEEATSVCTAVLLGGGGAVCAHLGIIHLLTFWQAHNAAVPLVYSSYSVVCVYNIGWNDV